MANMRDINKRFIGFSVRLELLKKIDKQAAREGKSRTEKVLDILESGTRNEVLNADDYEAISKEVKANEHKRNG